MARKQNKKKKKISSQQIFAIVALILMIGLVVGELLMYM